MTAVRRRVVFAALRPPDARFFDAVDEPEERELVERDFEERLLADDLLPPELRRAPPDFLPAFLLPVERFELLEPPPRPELFFDDFLLLEPLRDEDPDFDDLLFEDFLLEEPLREPPLPDDFFEEPFFDAAMGMSPFKSVGWGAVT
jgi:hypothetical protein